MTVFNLVKEQEANPVSASVGEKMVPIRQNGYKSKNNRLSSL
jgi:hypothetical protein